MQTSLQGIAQKAARVREYRFRNLAVMLDEDMLQDSWRYIRKDAAYGVDRISAQEYKQDLEGNTQRLVERLKRGSYRAKLVKRRYIPKGDGRMRLLGIPATEDKLAQVAVKRILEAIYEQDFLKCSYGYRPGIGAQEAVHDLTVKLQFGVYRYVVEADIKSFFEHVDHVWMVCMFHERIDWGKDRKGKLYLKRQTSRGWLKKSLKRLTRWCRENQNLELKELFRKPNAKLRGFHNYWSCGQLRKLGAVLPKRTANPVQVAQSPQSTAKLLLGWIHGTSGALPNKQTTDCVGVTSRLHFSYNV